MNKPPTIAKTSGREWNSTAMGSFSKATSTPLYNKRPTEPIMFYSTIAYVAMMGSMQTRHRTINIWIIFLYWTRLSRPLLWWLDDHHVSRTSKTHNRRLEPKQQKHIRSFNENLLCIDNRVLSRMTRLKNDGVLSIGITERGPSGNLQYHENVKYTNWIDRTTFLSKWYACWSRMQMQWTIQCGASLTISRYQNEKDNCFGSFSNDTIGVSTNGDAIGSTNVSDINHILSFARRVDQFHHIHCQRRELGLPKGWQFMKQDIDLLVEQQLDVKACYTLLQNALSTCSVYPSQQRFTSLLDPFCKLIRLISTGKLIFSHLFQEYRKRQQRFFGNLHLRLISVGVIWRCITFKNIQWSSWQSLVLQMMWTR